LDELDREEFYRLKKVSGKKERDAKAAEVIRLAEKQRLKDEDKANDLREEQESKDLLGDADNEDVIF
jgi:V-type H+-transporting ATPase subunit D